MKKASKKTNLQSKKPSPKRYVFAFGRETDGNARMRELLGGKGANLAEMASIGLPVPPGFTISTEVCNYFYNHGKTYPKQLLKDVKNGELSNSLQISQNFAKCCHK